MPKIEELTDINASYGGISKLNSHLDKIQTAFQNTLSRDGSTPNHMLADIDMNDNQLVNLSDPVLAHHAATKLYVDTLAFGGEINLNVAGRVRHVATYAEMQALTVADNGLTNGDVIITAGRLAANDGGLGLWYYSSGSAATTNSATVLASTSGASGRFLRTYDSGQFQLAWWGARGNNVDCTTEFNTAVADINTLGGGEARLDRGTTRLDGQASILGSNIKIKGVAGFGSLLDLNYVGSAILVGPLTGTRSQQVIFEGVYFTGVEGQHVCEQRYSRGLFFNYCLGGTLGGLVKIGNTGATSGAYITEIRSCEFGASFPTITVSNVVGTFTNGEVLTFGTSGATATLSSKNGSVYTILYLSKHPTVTETITGGSSGATATLSAHTQGLDFFDVRYGIGELNIYDSRIEGGYNWAVTGVNFSNNDWEATPGVAGLFDTCGIHDTYLARFGYNVKAVDRRLGNINWSNVRFHEAGYVSLYGKISTGNTRALDRVGGWSGLISNVDLLSPYAIGGVYARGLVLENDSAVNAYFGDLLVNGVHGAAMQNSLVELNGQRATSFRGLMITNVHASQMVGSADIVNINAGTTTAFVGCVLDGVTAQGTFSDVIASNGGAVPDSGLRIGHTIVGAGTFSSRINGAFARVGENAGTATYDPANLVDGAGVTTTVTVTGAATGEIAYASFSNDLQGIQLHAWVSAANTVSVRFQNETGGAIDLASGTLKAVARMAG